jgi:hypothetical protein
MGWIHVAQNRDQWRFFYELAFTGVFEKWGDFYLIHPNRTLLHGLLCTGPDPSTLQRGQVTSQLHDHCFNSADNIWHPHLAVFSSSPCLRQTYDMADIWMESGFKKRVSVSVFSCSWIFNSSTTTPVWPAWHFGICGRRLRSECKVASCPCDTPPTECSTLHNHHFRQQGFAKVKR